MSSHALARPPLDRRGFLTVLVGASSSLCARAAGARRRRTRPTPRRVIVQVFLDGGADGLNMLVPYLEPAYYAQRPSLAIPRCGTADDAVLDVDGRFGLHPSLAPWLELFRDGRARALLGVGYPGSGRSHFVEQDVWASATTAPEIAATGWLGRWLAAHEGRGPLRAVGFGHALPRPLAGEVPAATIVSLRDFAPEDLERLQTLRAPYQPDREGAPVHEAGLEAVEALEVLRALDPRGYVPEPEARYPACELGGQLRDAALLVKADVGVEAIALTLKGWDTHRAQGGSRGLQATLLNRLGAAVRAFVEDLRTAPAEVMLVTLSEFGRDLAENGTAGTEHGRGNVVFAFTNRQRAGSEAPIVGEWSGLSPDDLVDGRSPRHTTDFRDLYADLLDRHLGFDDVASVLPGWSRTPTALFR